MVTFLPHGGKRATNELYMVEENQGLTEVTGNFLTHTPSKSILYLWKD